MTQTLPFGEWLPGLSKHENPGCVVANNVIPRPGGSYAPVYGPRPSSLTTGSVVRGAARFYTVDGDLVTVAGTATALHKIAATATSTTGLMDIGAGEAWDFARFNDFIIATSLENNPQYLDDIDSDTTWSDLPGSPPKARYCARVGEFLMLGDVAGNPNRIQWSSFNSPGTSWAASRLTQAGFATLPREFGRIQRIVGGRYPMVFQERGIVRIDPVGPPTVFRVTEVSEQRGCVAPWSVVTEGSTTYFLSQDGFWATNGADFQPIGSNRINEWFWENCDNATLRDVNGAVDWQNECIVWAFKSPGSTIYDRAIRYSWTQDRWASMTVETDWLVTSVYEGLTVDDPVFGEYLVDSRDELVDNPEYRARDTILSAFMGGELMTFTDVPLQADIETGEREIIPGRRVFVSSGRVLGEGSEVWRIAAVPVANDRMEAFGAFNAPGVDGRTPLRADGQTMRLAARALEGSSWALALGMQVDARASGWR